MCSPLISHDPQVGSHRKQCGVVPMRCTQPAIIFKPELEPYSADHGPKDARYYYCTSY